MEILIIGVVLVALMVYASTKIKKSAARAFEREVIETEDFSLIKPEGFINPINENSEFAFKAHSKNFGENEAHDVHQAKVDLKIFSNEKFETVCSDIKKSADKILSEKVLTKEWEKQKICLLETEKIEKGTAFCVFHKIIESEQEQKIFDLKISVLQDFREQYEEKIDEMLNSFSVI